MSSKEPGTCGSRSSTAACASLHPGRARGRDSRPVPGLKRPGQLAQRRHSGPVSRDQARHRPRPESSSPGAARHRRDRGGQAKVRAARRCSGRRADDHHYQEWRLQRSSDRRRAGPPLAKLSVRVADRNGFKVTAAPCAAAACAARANSAWECLLERDLAGVERFRRTAMTRSSIPGGGWLSLVRG